MAEINLNNKKILRITTVPISLASLIKGQMKYMCQVQHMIVWAASADGEEIERVRSFDEVEHFVLPLTRTISPFKDLKALRATIKLIKQLEPDIVHTHTPKAGIIGMLAAWITKVPIRLHTVAGLPLLETAGNKRKLLDFVEKWTYKLATKVYPNSKGLHDIILQYRFAPEYKLKVIGNGSSNGIDTQHFSNIHFSETQNTDLKVSLAIKEDDFVFIFVGRIVKDKGINELIEAFTNIRDPNVKLLLVGNFERALDPLLPTTEQVIQHNPNIICVGFQKDVRPYFAISNCLVFPSYREGFPNVVMQAGAMGLPAIVTDINGCNEIIASGKNGIIIPAKDTGALEIALKQLLQTKHEWRTHASICREMITQRYEQKVVWEAIASEYKSLFENV